MATFSLSDLKNEVSKKYAPTVVENGDDSFTLQNMLQLPSERRDSVLELIEGVDGEDVTLDDQLKVFKDIILAVEINDRGQELLDLLGDNSALILELVNTWMEGSQLGEAER